MAEMKKFKKGTVIFREGDKEFWMYDLWWGSVGIYSGYGTPYQKKLTTLMPGAFFGELGMIGQEPRSATAVAEEDCNMHKITADDFLDYYRGKPAKVVAILQNTSHRLREVSRDFMEVCSVLSAYEEAKKQEAPVSGELVSRLEKVAGIGRSSRR